MFTACPDEKPTFAQLGARDAEQMISAIETGGLDALAFLEFQREESGMFAKILADQEP